MAGIKGMPSAKPSDLPSPTPHDEFDAALTQGQKLPAAQGDEFDHALVAGQQQSGDFHNPYTAALPAIGTVAGGVLGTAGGIPGEIGGAMLGGAAGKTLQNYIDTIFLGKPDAGIAQNLNEIGREGLTMGAGQATGLAAIKTVPMVADAAIQPVKAMAEGLFTAAKNEVQAPVTDMVKAKTNGLNIEQAGDQVKQLLENDIRSKNGKFVQSYSSLDNVSKALPIRDEARRDFTVDLKGWALDNFSGDNYKVIKKFADEVDAAGTGKHLEDINRQIGDARNVAFRTGATGQAKILGELQDRLSNFSEDQVTKLAKNVQAGKASPEELNAFNSMAKQQGITEADPTKYAKSIAKDYLSSKDKVASDYSLFKSYLEDVGEQSKIRADKYGPMTFLGKLKDVPSEKLVERMFDSKNAAALRTMQEQNPDVFDTVIKSKMNQIVEKASPTGPGELDVKLFRDGMNNLPKPTRDFLMNSDEMKTLSQVADHPDMARIQHIQDRSNGMLKKWVESVADLKFMTEKAIKAGSKTKVGKIAGVAARAGIGSVPANSNLVQRGIGVMLPQQNPEEQQ